MKLPTRTLPLHFDSRKGLILKIVLILLSIFIFIVLFGAGFFIKTRSVMIEESRKAEARYMLGAIRDKQLDYKAKHGSYAVSFNDLDILAPSICRPDYYFSYSATDTEAIATRCIAGGREPNAKKSYRIKIDYKTGFFEEDKINFTFCPIHLAD